MASSGLLFGWCEENNRALTDRLMAVLASQDVRKIADIAGGVIVEFEYTWYSITDNGGELNIEEINSPQTMRSVPYYPLIGPALSVGTMTYRILAVMRSKQIDYTFVADDLDATKII